MGRVLPEDVHRVLYLDCDTLPLEDLSALEQFDLKGCPLAMAQEPTARHSRKRELAWPPSSPISTPVCCSRPGPLAGRGHGKNRPGLLPGKGWSAPGPGSGRAQWGAGRAHLPPATPVQLWLRTDLLPLEGAEAHVRPRAFLPHGTGLSAGGFSPCHHSFPGRGTPWREGNRHPYRAAYEAALAKTPWRGAPVESGWQTYFRCFDLFNRLTRPFPLLRWRIINALIPAFMRYREQARKKKQHG